MRYFRIFYKSGGFDLSALVAAESRQRAVSWLKEKALMPHGLKVGTVYEMGAWEADNLRGHFSHAPPDRKRGAA